MTFSIHLDGLEEAHDKAVAQKGTFKRAVAAIKEAQARGFRVNINSTLFDGHEAEEVAEFFDFVTNDLKIDAITVSPGYSYERAPDQEHFLNRAKTKALFRDVFRRGKNKKWRFSQSSLFLNFLAGNETYECMPWGNPTRNIFGWQSRATYWAKATPRHFVNLWKTRNGTNTAPGNTRNAPIVWSIAAMRRPPSKIPCRIL